MIQTHEDISDCGQYSGYVRDTLDYMLFIDYPRVHILKEPTIRRQQSQRLKEDTAVGKHALQQEVVAHDSQVLERQMLDITPMLTLSTYCNGSKRSRMDVNIFLFRCHLGVSFVLSESWLSFVVISLQEICCTIYSDDRVSTPFSVRSTQHVGCVGTNAAGSSTPSHLHILKFGKVLATESLFISCSRNRGQAINYIKIR